MPHGAPRSDIAGVLLAAGRGSRFGATKLLAELDGEPLIRHVITRALRSSLTEVHVVLGHDAASVAAALPDHDRVRASRNPAYRSGLATSLHCGLRGLGASISGAVILLADMPLVHPKDIDAVAAALREGSTTVRTRYRDGVGHPVGFQRAVWPALGTVSGDRGARGLLDGMEVHEVASPRTTPRDVDEAADLEIVSDQLRAQHRRPTRSRRPPGGPCSRGRTGSI